MTLKEHLIKAIATETEQRLTAIAFGSGRIAAAEALAEHLNAAGLPCDAFAHSGSARGSGYVIAKVMVAPNTSALAALRQIRAAGLELDEILASHRRITHVLLKDVDVPLVINAPGDEVRAAAAALDMIVRISGESPESLQRQAA